MSAPYINSSQFSVLGSRFPVLSNCVDAFLGTPSPSLCRANEIRTLGDFSRQSLEAKGVTGKVLINQYLELIPPRYAVALRHSRRRFLTGRRYRNLAQRFFLV